MLPIMAEIPALEPASVTAGDTIQWKRTLPDYPAASGWVLKYRLINAAGKIDITASASGADHLVNIAIATSAAWPAGAYDWQAFVEKAGERYTVGYGRITVKPNLAAQSAGYDTSSQARKVLEAIEAVLEGRASQSHQDMEVAGRRIRHFSFAELLSLRDKYRAEARAEEAAENLSRGLGVPNKVLVRL